MDAARTELITHEYERMSNAAKEKAVEDAINNGELGHCDSCDRGCCDDCEVYSDGQNDGYDSGYRDAVLGRANDFTGESHADSRLGILKADAEHRAKLAAEAEERQEDEEIH